MNRIPGRLGCLTTIALVAVACAAPATSPSAGPDATSRVTGAPAPSAATSNTDPREPDLAGLFDIGGYSLYLECRGTGGPAVLFDAGSGSDSTTWNRSRKDFIGLVDNTFRRCIYDRANLGESDRVAGLRTSATAADDLHRLLRAAALEPPYVLVGRSFGGYNVRMFAATYPSDVRALELVETLTPEFQVGMLSLLTPEQAAQEIESFQDIEPPMDEVASERLVAAAELPDVPMLVIAGTKWHSGNAPWPPDWPGPALDALWDGAQRDLAASVPRGRLVVFEGGDHSLHFSAPERLANEINDFLAAL